MVERSRGQANLGLIDEPERIFVIFCQSMYVYCINREKCRCMPNTSLLSNLTQIKKLLNHVIMHFFGTHQFMLVQPVDGIFQNGFVTGGLGCLQKFSRRDLSLQITRFGINQRR